MEKKVLNNKIGIQITVILIGCLFIALGTLASLFSEVDFSGRYNSQYSFGGYGYFWAFTYIGASIFMTGVLMIISGSIKIANYAEMKKSLTGQASRPALPVYRVSQGVVTGLSEIREELAYLQQMQSDGLITEEEYSSMRIELLKKSRR